MLKPLKKRATSKRKNYGNPKLGLPVGGYGAKRHNQARVGRGRVLLATSRENTGVFPKQHLPFPPTI